ncbi:ABC transporter permease subunit [Exiguobacterium alkaliphilum]|uniref:ABC transporter permease n=1 Tax=Exiguobacterium alkaliphilum TaxID=1428684 RepID=A0ABT2KXN2_9BACL|nr:ABC transporter permease subunit [Exiguobacterium alkaliphilum]MCT4795693.1 ABC transporter permease [Exiguobacterium alkaliphilum]
MLSNVLLKKDWKQVSLLWILLIGLGILAYTIPVFNEMQFYDEQIQDIQNNPSQYQEGTPKDIATLTTEDFFNTTSGAGYWIGDLGSLLPLETVFFLYVVFGFLMASVLIGSERNSQMSDFSMSLPFSRNQLYISKWLIGVSGIVLSSIVGGTIMLIMIHTSRYAFLIEGQTLKVLAVLGFVILVGISVFTLSLWMGSFGGEAISQVLWSIVAFLFPLGILVLVNGSIQAMTGYVSYEMYARAMESLPMRILSPLVNIANVDTYILFTDNSVWRDFTTVGLSSSLLFIGLTFTLGLLMFNRAPQENNGRFFMFTGWLWLVHVVMVICFAMLGGIIFSAFSYPTSVTLYIIGFLIGGFLAHLLARRLLYRFNLQLKS